MKVELDLMDTMDMMDRRKSKKQKVKMKSGFAAADFREQAQDIASLRNRFLRDGRNAKVRSKRRWRRSRRCLRYPVRIWQA